MNPILLIGMLAAAFFIGKAGEEVEGKSKLAHTLFLALYSGEILYILFLLFTLPISILSVISGLIEIIAIWCLFFVGSQMVIQKRKIKNLEEEKC